MPILDERTRGSDRREAARPWVPAVVILAICVVLALLAVAIGMVAVGGGGRAAQPNAMWIREAQTAHARGDFTTAVSYIQAIDGKAPLDVLDKHTLFKTGAESYANLSKPQQAADYYERYLSWGTGIRSAECSGCHGPAPNTPPARAADLLQSSLANGYVAALTDSKALTKRRNALRSEAGKKPTARHHLLLYHLEMARGKKAAAAAHARALRAMDGGGK